MLFNLIKYLIYLSIEINNKCKYIYNCVSLRTGLRSFGLGENSVDICNMGYIGLRVDGSVYWQKEIWHTGGYTDFRANVNATHSILGKWIGFKAIMYTINN